MSINLENLLSIKENLKLFPKTKLLIVTKNQNIESISALISDGYRLFGENRVQEAFKKYSNISIYKDLELHLIGPLQRNKVKQALKIFNTIFGNLYCIRNIVWEIFYFLQFISLEFFFRGFLVHGLKKEIGDYSVLVMVIPYCMIHFQKPFLETIGAIFAGLILGYLSLRKNSIATGIALHFSVAITMDVFALYHLGYI